MAISESVQLKIVSAFHSVVTAIIGATVFMYSFVHLVPLSQYAIEALGIFGAYYGTHVYASNKFAGASNPAPKA